MIVHKGAAVRISVSEAKGQLTELVRRAEAGDEVISDPARSGRGPACRGQRERLNPAERRQLLESVRAEGPAKASPGPSAARSQDFLYDEYGLPK